MRDAQDIGVEGALLSSNRRQRSFGNLGKACTAPCLTPGLTHQPHSTVCLRVMVPEELKAETVSTRWPSSWPNFQHHHCGVLRATVD